ncbi:MAG: gyrase subunit B protein [Candidatus Kaiserbacteria bacterium GW2011_GWB1_52_6]|uniref:DNA topoisomerase (ATP-hydrolyzing) n=3 Tax=Candidatus Kaiseribacteriota TaxID=1752734 RepID=A0A0G1XK59_9BACT|nr:MAG: gyrase subunit B protein [Candidatus Kaiserbacteria bacterium GW2011_GWA2_52_12]KKW27349.1 MAG: gyrase subunit B protein [Candidatus Kaiserbacteria bacterium GW2011_GWB1_52_6]KKW31603.1 MAG: gyrase subunit B protein [Candidatus Kaiserbacteria bacterium GW2011_GWC2_52_8b]
MAEKKHKSVKNPTPTKGGSSYGAADITVLEGLEAVRRRPGMYIGTTSLSGLHHLVWEVFDNSRDEAMGGFANDIEIALLPDNLVRVADNGRGIPVEIHPKTKVSTLETVMTKLHAGGKFGGSGYKVSGGLHGVGVSVVNALSSYVRAEVHRDGGKFVQEYKNGGKPVGKTKKIGSSNLHGTIITFEPDATIFPEREFDFDTIVSHMRQQAYLVRGLRISMLDLRHAPSTGLRAGGKINDSEVYNLRELGLDAPSTTFYFEGGLRSLVAFQNRHLEPIHKNIFYIEKEQDGVTVEVALQYVDDITARLSAFANNIYNSEGGMHVTGFKAALTRTLNNQIKSSGGKESDSFTGDDVLEGLTAVVSVKLREIQFEGQTKAKLGSVEARSATETVFSEGFNAFLEEHPEEARSIIGKVTLAMKARKAAKAAKDSILRKGALDGMTLPGKLADCQTKSADEAEIFIVEGDSAGGTAKMGRDRRTQAVLPLRGKILNIERARLDKMLMSEQIKNLVVAMGTAIGDIFDIGKLRYHKVIIATDADVDGAHIRTLLLTLFYRHFRPIIDGGYLYIAQPPLFKIKKGKEIIYAYSDEERVAAVGKDMPVEVEEVTPEEIGESEETEKAKKSPKVSVQRYKGLGEMNSEELWETTMDPARRILKQVAIEDAQEADQIFDMLMGTDVPARKSFIQSHAKEATLDI